MLQVLRLIAIAILIVLDVGASFYTVYTLAHQYNILMLAIIALVQAVCILPALALASSYTERAKQELPVPGYR